MSGVDVLAVMGRSLVEGLPLSRVDDMTEARAAVAELIEAAGRYFNAYCVDEAGDTFDCSDFAEVTGCSREQHEDAKSLRAALARVAGGAE